MSFINAPWVPGRLWVKVLKDPGEVEKSDIELREIFLCLKFNIYAVYIWNRLLNKLRITLHIFCIL